MKVKEINFRDVEDEICYIEKSENIEKVLTPFDDAQDSTGFLGYGYVDYNDGIVFEVLCRAKKEEDDYATLPSQYSTSVKIKMVDILEQEIEILEVNEKIYDKKIKKINDHTPSLVKEVRELDFLDDCRHNYYPDQVLVNFGEEDLWVKITKLNEEKGCLVGVLLDEAKNGKKKNAVIEFALKKREDGTLYCFCL